MAELLTCPTPLRPFPGFAPEAVSFLRNLKRNNRPDWFQPRKEQYEKLIKVPMLDLACCLSRVFARFAPDYVTPPDKSVFRIYRDDHFSHRQKPYKTHMAAVFARRGAERLRGPCFYFHFTDKELLALAGAYSPERDEMLAYRNLLAEHYCEFRETLADPKLVRSAGELQGEQLSHMPQGFCPGHPAARVLRHKQWYLVSILDVKLLTTPRLLPELARSFEAMAPFVEFLNRAFPQKRKAKTLAFATADGPCHHDN
jgi:uncharacterized protein (TIGR02453 family)